MPEKQIAIRKEDWQELARQFDHPALKRTVAALILYNHHKGREVKWNNDAKQTVLIGPVHLIERVEDYLR